MTLVCQILLVALTSQTPLSIVVPDASTSRSGERELVDSIRKKLSANLQVRSRKETNATIKRLRIRKRDRRIRTLARLGRALKADYVLRVRTRRVGWLHKATAELIHVKTRERRMKFVVGYYHPKTEAADRGLRIGAKTLWRLSGLHPRDPPKSTPTEGLRAEAQTVASVIPAAPARGAENVQEPQDSNPDASVQTSKETEPGSPLFLLFSMTGASRGSSWWKRCAKERAGILQLNNIPTL